MDDNSRIELNPDILEGKPIIKGTRISIEFIVELIANGWSIDEILENYPQLNRDDILAAVQYALYLLKAEKVYRQ